MFVAITFAILFRPAGFDFEVVSSTDSSYSLYLGNQKLDEKVCYKLDGLFGQRFIDIEVRWDDGVSPDIIRETIQVPLYPGRVTTIKLNIPRRSSIIT